MNYKAEILADSRNIYTGTRLVTMGLKYPRFVHAELMTHRVFSRNASSSRAIPVAKLIDQVEASPVYPVEWGTNKPGMQAGDPLGRETQTAAENEWGLALIDAVKHARKLKDLGVHKQLVNRLLEPFSTISVIVTATEWDNFFKLRISDKAQPEIRKVAEAMKKAMDESTPVSAKLGYVHAPYVQKEERESLEPDVLMMISAARCARVSYLNHDGLAPDMQKDMTLAGNLMVDNHASPFEHQAYPTASKQWVRNFRDWNQHRAMIGL